MKKSSLPIPFRMLALAGLSCFISACMVDKDNSNDATGKVDPATSGQSLVTSFSQMGGWQNTVIQPSIPALPSLGNSVAQAPSFSSHRHVVVGSSLADDSCTHLTVDSSTQALGYRTYTCQEGDTTAVARVKWDDKAQDSVWGNENILYSSYTLQTSEGFNRIEFNDADGDGLVNVLSVASKVKVNFTIKKGLTLESSEVVLGSGPDLDFNQEGDNVIYAAQWNRKINNVLKATASFLDDDGDGIVIDQTTVSHVKILLDEYEPTDRPLVYKTSIVARIRNLGFGKGEEPVSFRATETLKTDRVNSVSFKNSKGTEDFLANDTMHAFLETVVSSASDTLKSAKLEIVFNPGSDLKSDLDDHLIALHFESHKRFGWERDVEFHFIPTIPVLHGEEAKSGTFSGKTTYADGRSATLTGSFTETIFMATFTGPDGKSISVTYNKSGKIISG